MLIDRLQVTNYRSCLDLEFGPDPNLSVLIGPNASGKTNVLRALMLLQKLATEEESYFRHDESPTGQARVKARFTIDGKTAILTADLDIYTDDRNDDVILSSKQSWYLRDYTQSATRVDIPLFFANMESGRREFRSDYMRYMWRRKRRRSKKLDERALAPIAATAAYLSEMRYYSASQFTNPSRCPVSFEIEETGKQTRGIRLQGHAKFLYDLYREFERQTAGYLQFFDIIGPNGIGLVDEINFNAIKTSSVDYSVRSGGRIKKRTKEKSLIVPQLTIGTHELSPNQLSEGTFKTITLLFYLITESSNVLLIEEPEVCVHHGLLSSIIELIKTFSTEKQIVVSTHSDFVLDHVEPENVFCISRTPEDGTKVRHLTKALQQKELTALKRFLESEGNLGEYWRHGALE